MNKDSENSLDREEILNWFESHSNLNLPYAIEFDSQKPGKHLVVVGATHGSEPIGVVAAQEFFKHLQTIQLKSGKVTFVIGNPEAFREDIRFIDLNMNRAFEDNLDLKLYEHQRVAEFREFFKSEKIDLLLDLHSYSAGVFVGGVVNEENLQSFETFSRISTLDTMIVVNQRNVPGALIFDGQKYGFEGLMFECGYNKSMDTLGYALDHINNALVYLDILDKKDILHSDHEHQISETLYIYDDMEPIKPGKNFRWTTGAEVENDAPIKAGQSYAIDNDGPKVASRDSILIIPDKNPKYGDHDAGFIGQKYKINRTEIQTYIETKNYES
jgi:succinylglutamate desuccinylase